MMDPKIKERWLKALRGGAFEQGRDRLRQCNADGVTRHCCLGVLGEILAPPSQWARKEIAGNDLHATFLRSEGLKKSGLKLHQMDQLADMNDRDRLSFEQIADWIEREL